MFWTNCFDYLFFCWPDPTFKNTSAIYKVWKFIQDWMHTIVYVGAFYLACVIFLVEGYQIPSGSMEPTFQGDLNFLKDDRIFGIKAISRFFPIERGDIVIFLSAEDQQTFIVKRVVGLPGEKIEIKNGRVYINGQLLDDPPIFKDLRYALPMIIDRYGIHDELCTIRRWKNMYGDHPVDPPALCFGCYYPELDKGNRSFAYQIPSDAYFVMGDNTFNSHDSRYWGALPRRNILGKASLIWWPIGRGEVLRHGIPTKQFIKFRDTRSRGK